MNLSSAPSSQRSGNQSGFTLSEVLIAVAILGVSFISLYTGMSAGFAMTQVSRENLRATQIMVEKMEGIRLFNWNQVTASNMIPTQFTTRYYPGLAGDQAKGITYSGTIVVTNLASMPYSMQYWPSKTYDDKLRTVSVQVDWKSGEVQRTRYMSTLVSRDGLQNYVFHF